MSGAEAELRFYSYDEVRAYVSEKEATDYIQLWVEQSRTIEGARRKGLKRDIELALKYYEITYRCIHSGTRVSRSTGLRPGQSTYRNNCPFILKLKASADGKYLQVIKFTDVHNHNRSEEVYALLPRQRGNDSERVKQLQLAATKAKKLLKFGPTKKFPQLELPESPGMTLEELHDGTRCWFEKMECREDSAPFVLLRERSQKMKDAFDADIKDCLSFLDAQITALLCDPNPDQVPYLTSLSAEAHFTKAKLDIFVELTKMCEVMCTRWTSEMAIMRADFLGKVEEFLTGTKLEAKFPSKMQSSPRTTPGKYPTPSPARRGQGRLYPALDETIFYSDMESATPMLDCVECVVEVSEDSSEQNGAILPNDVECVVDISDDNSDSNGSAKEITIFAKQTLKSRESVLPAASGNISDRKSRRTTIATVHQPPATPMDQDDSNTGGNEIVVSPVQTRSGRRKTMTPSRIKSTLTGIRGTPKLTEKKAKRRTIVGTVQTNEIADPSPKRVRFDESAKMEKKDADGTPKINKKAVSRAAAVLRRPVSKAAPTNLSLLSDGASANEEINNIVKMVDEKVKRKSTGSQLPTQEATSSDSESAGGDGFTSWVLLQELEAPECPGVYELKVVRAKKTAFIGGCDNLREMLALHREVRKSQHKYLDKFLERNGSDVQVRYLEVPSVEVAQLETGHRMDEFVAAHGTTPAYN